MLLKFSSSRVRNFLHILLFVLYWTACSGELSLYGGIAIFLVLYIPLLFPAFRGGKAFLKRSITYVLFLFFLFPAVHLYQLMTAGLSPPWDFGGILFQSHYILIAPPLFLCLLLVSAAGRISWFYIFEVLLYSALLAFFTGKPDWNLQNYSGCLILTYLALSAGGGGILLLLLWGRQKTVEIAVFRDIPVFLMLLCLVLIPVSRLYRSESVKEGGGLLESSLFHFDFTDYLTLESKISMKDELVLLLQMETAPEKSYLRRYILSAYDEDRGFFRDPENTPESPDLLLPDYRVPEKPEKWDIPVFSRREDLEQTLYFINFDSAAFLGMNLPEQITPYYTWEDSSFSRIYTVGSSVSRAGVWDLIPEQPLQASRENSPFLEYYTEWGKQDNPRQDIKALAEDITRGIGGDYQKAAAIQEYLQREYFYSLSPGTAEDGDQLSYFLFNAKKGYCSYFAFSMTLLCRSIGIPARVALGFWVDTAAEVLNFYPVNANQAHAWVEIYFPRFGWMEFDPTSQTLAPGENYEFAGFNPEELEPFITEILAKQESLTVSDITTSESSASPGRFIRAQWNKVLNHPILAVSGILVLLAGLSLLRLLIALSPFPRTEKRILYWYRFHRTVLITGLGLDRAVSTPLELAEACRGRGFGDADTFCRNYLLLRFGAYKVRQNRKALSDWFRSAGEMRRRFYGFIGIGKSIRLFAVMLIRPGRRL